MRAIKPRRTLVEQAYNAILDAICDGTLAPGARVTQDELAVRLHVSRQPVLTALGLLKQQGFLIDHGRRGLAVAPVDPARFDAIYQIRSALEPLAAKLATERMTPELIERGRAIVADGRKVAAAGDAKATLQADVDFHNFIYEASGNPLIVEAMQLHWQHLRRAMGEVLRRPRMTQQVWREHVEVMEAMAAGDGARSARLLQQHVDGARVRVGEEIAAMEQERKTA
jgi:DNA-binding GntR family transcriptional regulator